METGNWQRRGDDVMHDNLQAFTRSAGGSMDPSSRGPTSHPIQEEEMSRNPVFTTESPLGRAESWDKQPSPGQSPSVGAGSEVRNLS